MFNCRPLSASASSPWSGLLETALRVFSLSSPITKLWTELRENSLLCLCKNLDIGLDIKQETLTTSNLFLLSSPVCSYGLVLMSVNRSRDFTMIWAQDFLEWSNSEWQSRSSRIVSQSTWFQEKMSDKGEYLILDKHVERNKINVHKNIFILSSLPTSKYSLYISPTIPRSKVTCAPVAFPKK